MDLLMANLAFCSAGYEWGSEEQIEAQNQFGIMAENHLSSEAFDKLETYWMHATTDEAIAFAFELMGGH